MEVNTAKTVENMEKRLCAGCGVCANVCPNACISMNADTEGFVYPRVDASLCSSCEICTMHCPVLNPPKPYENQMDPQVYAAWSLDEEVRYNSTSGGIFTELAKTVLNQNGFVAGARYNDRHLVEHAVIDRVEDIPLLRQSKYVQSETKDIYTQVETALRTGRPVMFVGTPCQCAGLRVLLRKPYENLLLCDFICRGVNSPLVYLKYLEELECQYGSRIKQVWFKNKTYGWNKFGTKIIFEDGQEYFGGRDTDPFMYGYIKRGLNLYMRPSCGQCRFKGVKRSVDITLGDFWGVKLHGSSDNTDAGVSVLMIHSSKGQDLFKCLSNVIYFEKHTLEEVIMHNDCLINSPNIRKGSKDFYLELYDNGFNKAIKQLRRI